jgi:hypothetical protein
MIIFYKLTLELEHSLKARNNDRSKYFAIISHIDDTKCIEKCFYCVRIKLVLVKVTPQAVLKK